MARVEQIDVDVCVVGAGIVGLAHALEARSRGLRVVVLERSRRAVGASVRNFGHVLISGMAAGEPFEAAQRARERWLEHGPRAGLVVRECGTVVVARAPDELAVLEAVAADEARGGRMLTAAEVGALVPVPTGELVGGMHAVRDLRVDPRRAVAALAALLADDPGAEVRFGTRVHALESGLVHAAGAGGAAGLEVRADHTFLCPGPDYDGLAPELAPRRPQVTRCKLQMLRVAAPGGRRYDPALLTGLSLLRYPGFADRPEADAVRRRFEAQAPELVRHGIHLVVTQLPDGDVVLGDTHEYDDAVSPFGDEALDELVLREACRLLGAERLQVRERWHGVYPIASSGGPFLIEHPLPGVTLVEVVSGVGMTTGLGLAPVALDAALGAPAAI